MRLGVFPVAFMQGRSLAVVGWETLVVALSKGLVFHGGLR